MDHMTHHAHGPSEKHASLKMPDAHGSHDRHAGHSVAVFRDRFWLSLVLTIPVVAWPTARSHAVPQHYRES
jgi:Cu2+-exporting ATPase